MVVGHFGIAELLLDINKTIPVLPVLIGVSYPDLVWPVLIMSKKEEVRVDPSTPLGSATRFTKFPYSHSLVLSGLLTLIPSLLFAWGYHRWIVGAFFFMAAVSHWLLDAVVHLGDVPVLGFGKDKKIGLGLWKYAKTSFWIEYGLFVACTLLFTPRHLWVPLLIAATAFHGLNANSFFGFTKKNTVKDSNAIAISALFGFPLMIVVFNMILSVHR
jgi:hypothetical protein